MILDAVAHLHTRGHERLRILPGMSGSGLHWRIAVASVDNFTDGPGHPHVKNYDAALVCSTAAEHEVAGQPVDAPTTVEEMAGRILTLLPDPGLGTDPDYVRWYAELMQLVHRHRALPIAYADYFEPAEGWEVGWGSGIRVSAPPGIGKAPAARGTNDDG